jgi:transposase-like protein
MKEIYGVNLSASAISIITSKVSQTALERQNRPLDSLYSIVRTDGIAFKVRDNGKVVNKTVYLHEGLNKEGLKEVSGMRAGKTESASFRSGVLTDPKARGAEDIPRTVADNLSGFADAVKNVFPENRPFSCAQRIKSATPAVMSHGRIRKNFLPI